MNERADRDPSRVDEHTARVVRAFVRSAIESLSVLPEIAEPVWEYDSALERGPDDNFRENKKRVRVLWLVLSDAWLSSVPGYRGCIERLHADPVIGGHLNRLIGTVSSAQRIEPISVLSALVYAVVDDQEHIEFSDERFNKKWTELEQFFCSDSCLVKLVAPLPGLDLPRFPLLLNSEIELDRFTEEEATRCFHIGLIRPMSMRFPVIDGKNVVGVRCVTSTPTIISEPDQSIPHAEAVAEGRFGRRPLGMQHLLVDDVLSALRLFKRADIRAAGYASWTDAYALRGGTMFQLLGQWPLFGSYALSEDEVPGLLRLWRLLEDGAGTFAFSIHRFNLAFDRGRVADRIVDLVIAAESLLLGDLDTQYRGELRYRFALRAAKFIEHPRYSQHDVFRVMRQAYDARSAIVHGGVPSETHLPEDRKAKLAPFVNAVEELVRLGLRKALAMTEDAKKLRQAEYWDGLVLSNGTARSDQRTI
jgi:hypothetical protein